MKLSTQKLLRIAACQLALAFSASAHAEIIFPTPHDGGTTVPQLPSYLYLRCNSTSTTINGQSRLQPYQRSGVYSVVFEVKNADYVSNGDNCIFTATSQADTASSDAVNFSIAGGFLQAPNFATPAFGTGNATFKVKYSSLRRYRAILALTNPPSFAIMPADGKSNGSDGDGDVIITF